jgi:II/X family phage/plasmid replication protein
MIDWVDFTAPLVHEVGPGSPFYAGEVLALSTAGELDWGIYKRMEMEGSHSTKIQIRSAFMADGGQAIRVSGNLAKWFQGHNIFGTNNLQGLVHEALSKVMAMGGITPSEIESSRWKSGDIDLLRVDVTESVDFGNRERVLNAIRSLDATANLKFRGRGQYNGHSLLFGKGSRHWSLTLYSKGAELQKHKLPLSLLETSLPQIADGLLRIEFRMLSMHLKRLGLDGLFAWGDNTASEVHQSHLEKLEISETTMLDIEKLKGLPPRLHAAYQLWKDGHDLRAMYPRPTFYRYRSQLLVHGIDISVKQERETTNVIPLRVVLIGKPLVLPEWAMNSPYFFEPRYNAI